MSASQASPPAAACPPTVDELQRQIRLRLDEIIAFCLNDQGPASFLAFEAALLGLLRSLGCLLIQLSLRARHDRLDPAVWRARGSRMADPAAERTLKTSCGPVAYIRAFFVPRHGGGPGVHPLDVVLGLTRDAYSPLVIGWFCRLATRMSFQVASGLGGMFLGAAPPASAIEEWVLGLARPAYVYLSDGPLPENDGAVLVIEIDGKAAPTATEQELARRRGPRAHHQTRLHVSAASGPGESRASGAEEAPEEGGQEPERPQRHAGGDVHVAAGRGRSAARPNQQEGVRDVRIAEVGAGVGAAQATRRGFPPGTAKTVQIVVDGETCLEQRLRRLFRGAILTLDIRHAQEKLWEAGRLFHREGSAELTRWVEELVDLLYKGHVPAWLGRLEQAMRGISPRGPGTNEKRKVLKRVILGQPARWSSRRSCRRRRSWRGWRSIP